MSVELTFFLAFVYIICNTIVIVCVSNYLELNDL
jgi:hypothetical protein